VRSDTFIFVDKELFDEPTQQSGYRSVCRIAANPLLEVLLAIRISEEDNELVVMKRVRGPYREDYAFIKRLLGAARAALPLAHRNVVGLREVVPDSMSIVGEYLPADSLHAMMRRGLPVAVGCTIATGVAAALMHAHSSASRPEIAHQAISPWSILVSDSGEVKLDDFGAMRVLATHAGAGELAQQVMRYAAPEAGSGARPGKPIAPAADLYALGAVLHEVLTGMPFSRQMLPRPSIKNAEVPPQLDLLVARLLSAQAERRPSAAEAHEQLLELPQASPQMMAQWVASFSTRRAQRRAVEQRAFELASARGVTAASAAVALSAQLEDGAQLEGRAPAVASERIAPIAPVAASTPVGLADPPAIPAPPPADSASAIPIEVVDDALLGRDAFDALVASAEQLIDDRTPYSSLFPLPRRRSHADTGLPSSHPLSGPNLLPHRRRWVPAAIATATMVMLGGAAVWLLAEEAAERAGAQDGSAEILVPDGDGRGDGAAASSPELAHRVAPSRPEPRPAAAAPVTEPPLLHREADGRGDELAVGAAVRAAPPVEAQPPRGRRSARHRGETSGEASSKASSKASGEASNEPSIDGLASSGERTIAPTASPARSLERREPALPALSPPATTTNERATPTVRLEPRAVSASHMKKLSGEAPTLRISGLDSPAAPSSTRSIRVQICTSAAGKVTSVTAKVPPEVLASLRSSIARWTYAPYFDDGERGVAAPVCFVDSIKMQLEH
jgi:serine/threonine protein kinase